MTRTTTRASFALLTTLAVGLAGCGTEKTATTPAATTAAAASATTAAAGAATTAAAATTATTAAAAPKADLKMGPGMTATEIKLGVITDETGTYAALGKGTVQGLNLFWDEQNAAGGVCGRKVTFVKRDAGYDVQKAVAAYNEIKDQVLALQQQLGSPMTTALLPQIDADKMMTSPVSWASNLLASKYIVMAGTPYSVEMIDGIDFLMREKGLKAGDKVGMIYANSEYGKNGLLGATIMAKARGFELLGEAVDSKAGEATAQMSKFKDAGVKAVLLTHSPKMTASVLPWAVANGLNVPFLGSNPTWDPEFLKGPAKDALVSNFYVAQSASTFTDAGAGPTKVRELFTKKYPTVEPQNSVTFGYGQADIFFQIMKKACDLGDMSRDGLATAFTQMKAIDTGGILSPIDYSNPGQAPAREVIVASPDAGAKGGLKQLTPLFSAPEAKAFTLDKQAIPVATTAAAATTVAPTTVVPVASS
jgi:ABC-type branched-subunit amino acid transport system substrate-binding protein